MSSKTLVVPQLGGDVDTEGFVEVIGSHPDPVVCAVHRSLYVPYMERITALLKELEASGIETVERLFVGQEAPDGAIDLSALARFFAKRQRGLDVSTGNILLKGPLVKLPEKPIPNIYYAVVNMTPEGVVKWLDQSRISLKPGTTVDLTWTPKRHHKVLKKWAKMHRFTVRGA